MKRSGTADLPLHDGRVPAWLATRMTELGTAIAEQVILNYGQSEFLTRLSDPFWFHAYGVVIGMDWHSSGITTSVLGALKRGINPHFSELGPMVCGSRGRHSVRTPDERRAFSLKTGLDGEMLADKPADGTSRQQRRRGWLSALPAFLRHHKNRRMGSGAAGNEFPESPRSPVSLALGDSA
jgi:hypothetical protein